MKLKSEQSCVPFRESQDIYRTVNCFVLQEVKMKLKCSCIFTVFQANSLADPSFPCPLCGAAVGDEITPVECTVALEVT